MRLNRYLASCGLGSRRSVESLITEGRVRVNGRDCLDLGTRISDGDRVEVNGEEIKPRQELSVIFHKPRGFETTRKGKSKEPTVYDLLPNHFRDLHHVGRLDKQSEGLLLFTNSGDLSQQLLHPRHQVEKEYEVVIDRPLRDGDRAKLRAGIRLKEGLARAERIDILSRRRFHMILTQGWNRQIRRMLKELGYETKTLRRFRFGTLELGHLAPGRWRHLREREKNALLKLVNDGPKRA